MKINKKTTQTPDKAELELLRLDHTREQIANKYGVSVSQVKRWISSLGVKKKISRSNRRNKPKLVKVKEPNYDSGLSMMEKAKLRLGERLKEKNGTYLLDGRPTKVDLIVKEAGLSRST